jgi:ubiquinone/menaquinone biosynthesis C-methylase UbiE
VRIDYASHDGTYKRYKAAGAVGWDQTDAAYREREAALATVLANGHAPAGGKLLELGCGAGNMSIWLAKRGYQVAGIDIAPTAVDWAIANAAAAGVIIRFERGDVCTLESFPDGGFDCVLDGHCLHCIIGPDRPRMLAAAHRVLKPGGYFLIDTMCGPNVDASFFKGYDPITRCTIIGDLATRYLGLPEVILAEVEHAGFTILHTQIDKELHHSNLIIEARRDK